MSMSRNPEEAAPQRTLLTSLTSWLDAGAGLAHFDKAKVDQIDWLRVIPFIGMHITCVAVVFVGTSTTALVTAFVMYAIRMFAITGFYHRYFSHRSFKTSRAGQFVFALLGASAVQRGPIWWAAHHRHHHAFSDQEPDVHSPVQRGFLWSHMGWFLSRRHFEPDLSRVRDLLRFPELKLLDRFDILVPVALAVGLFGIGAALEHVAPGLHPNRWQMLGWGFFASTVIRYHAPSPINPLCHRFGNRPY